MFNKLRKNLVLKILAGVIFMLALFSLIVGIIGYRGFTETLLQQYADGAFRTANHAASYLNGDDIDRFYETRGTTQRYQLVWEKLDQLCNATGSTFIYVITPDLDDYGRITFVFSTVNHDTSYSEFDIGYVRETTNDDYRTKYRKLYDGSSSAELVVRDKGYIETDPHITAMVPVKGTGSKTKAILCVQRQMDVLSEARKEYVRSVIRTLIVLVLAVVVLQSLYLSRMLLQPVREITKEASRFASENTIPGKKLAETIRNKDDIGILAESVDQMEEQIGNYVDNLTRITAEKERISTELSLAARIQMDMLITIFPPFPDRKEFDLYAEMDPAREVGGDFYDFFMIDDDHLCLEIADVSGKGIPAALFMMASKIVLKNNAMSGKSPAEILTATNESICSNNKEQMFVTVWIGILEISTGRLTAANAGHEYPILMKPDGKYELFKDKHGMVIGAFSGLKYKEYEILMEPGSRIFLYTDGVPEATDRNGKMFGTARTVETLNSAPLSTPDKVLAAVHGAVDAFVGEAEQFDDLTMLCVDYRGPVKA